MSETSTQGTGPGEAGRSEGRAAPRLLTTAILFTLAAAVGAGSELGIVRSVHVASVNMVPTLEPEDRVMVNGIGGEPGLGDVVVYRTPFDADHLQLGRIVAVEGDRVEMTTEGLRTNGQSVAVPSPAVTGESAPSPAISGESATSSAVAGESVKRAADSGPAAAATPEENDYCQRGACLVTAETLGDHRYFTRRTGGLAALLFPRHIVPKGHVFVLSDNRVDERDSRIYGAIPRAAIVGVASFVYYASDGTGIRWDRMNRRVS